MGLTISSYGTKLMLDIFKKIRVNSGCAIACWLVMSSILELLPPLTDLPKVGGVLVGKDV